MKVKTKLFDDNTLRGVGISVDTFRGYVTLTGAVDNETQRRRAVSLRGYLSLPLG
jgi:osmotically-inducible protein OsmY